MNFTLVFGTLGLLSLSILFMVYACVVKRTRASQTIGDLRGPRVAVLKPLKGIDGGLEENLRALYAQSYENFEVVLGAEDERDPALSVARKVAAAHPERTTRIVTGSFPSGLNPKVRLLRKLAEFTSAEVLLVSDSNVRPRRDYLAAIVGLMERENSALVHNVLLGRDGEGLGGRLEDLQLTGWVAGSVCFTEEGGHPCVIGKSMLLRRSSLESIGGFQLVADYLAEDYLLGSRFVEAGYKVSLSTHALPVVNSGRGIEGFWNRHVRWGQMRRRIAPTFYLGEVFVNPTPFLVAAWAVSDGLLAGIFAGAQLLKWGSELAIVRMLGGRLDAKTAALLPLKDFLLFPIWATSLVRRTVNWRGNRMLVGPKSLLIPLDAAPVAVERELGTEHRHPISATAA